MENESKRIINNTIFLYIRTFIILLVSLYTVRLTIKILGFEDYGIYNAVGGIVGIFSFLNTTMVSASQRYFSYLIGLKDSVKLNQYFNIINLMYFFVTILIFILAETVGFYFYREFLVVPIDRMDAADYVYHFSVLTILFNLLTIPYSSIIIARERMKIYAYISIVEVIIILVFVYLLLSINLDSLKLFSILICFTALLKYFFYLLYSKNRFSECKYQFFWKKEVFVEISKYFGWNLYGTFAATFRNQSNTIILNIFFGPVINSALAIANQISIVLNQFITSFIQAVQPQIVKKYAETEVEKMLNLVLVSSRFSYYLLLIVAIPLIIELPNILSLWLGDFPEYTVTFSRILIINALIESFSYPIITAIQATGKIKIYQLIVGSIFIGSIAVAYFLIKIGFQPESVLYVTLLTTIINQIIRVYYMKYLFSVSMQSYFNEVLIKTLLVTIISLVIPLTVYILFGDSPYRFVAVLLAFLFSCLYTIYFIGIHKSERQLFKNILKNKLNKF